MQVELLGNPVALKHSSELPAGIVAIPHQPYASVSSSLETAKTEPGFAKLEIWISGLVGKVATGT
jgi:hypothetical protein